MPIIAEDLGVITPDVEALRKKFGFPGMRILQFAFEGGSGNAYLPHNHEPDTVVYTGTHDNDTTLGWWQAADEATRHLSCSGVLALGTLKACVSWQLSHEARGLDLSSLPGRAWNDFL